MSARFPWSAWLMLFVSACGAHGFTDREPTGPGVARDVPLPTKPLAGEWYRIRRGDTLSRIAARHEVPIQDLAEINDLPDPNLLVVGRELFIPRDGPKSSHGRGRRRPKPSPPDGSDEAPTKEARFIRPVAKARITSRFGMRWGRHHDGVDFAAPMGTPIRAAADGVVIYSGTARGYGNIVLIKHDERFVTVYAHNRRNLVKKGQRVRQGQTIAELGSTGRSTGPHVHFEVRDRGKPKNPLFYLRDE